jgi:hypothetical protein
MQAHKAVPGTCVHTWKRATAHSGQHEEESSRVRYSINTRRKKMIQQNKGTVVEASEATEWMAL